MNGSTTTQPGDAGSVTVGKLSPPVVVSVGAVPISMPAAAAMAAATDPNLTVAKLSPPVNVSSGAVPLAPVPPAPDAAAASLYARAQGPELAIAGFELGYNIAKDVLSEMGDITYDLEKLDGTKAPRDDQTFAGTGEWRRGVAHVRSGVMETRVGDEQSAEFDVEWSYNGHCVRDVRIKPTNTNPAFGWKLHVAETIVPRPDLEKPDVAAVEVTFIYRHSHRVWRDRIFHEQLILYGDGRYTHAGWWEQYGSGTMPAVPPPSPDLPVHEEVEMPIRITQKDTAAR
jgi:hypothetical protein